MSTRSLLVALLTVCGGVACVSAGRQLKQVTFFADTPAAAGSTSIGLNGGLAVRPDGTVHAAAGGSTATTTALSNPLLNVLTGGAYRNRPKAASSAYTQIPLLQQLSIFPTLSYGLAEGKGDVLSTSNGAWLNGEFGYNPLNNNLGASASTGSTSSANVGASERVGEVNPDAGFSGVEFAGYANDQTNLADSRTDQSAQAIAYPYNILSPVNPLTCTQALLGALTITQYDLGAPVTPLPRPGPAAVVPFCLNLFNFATLDDFANFVNNDNRTSNNTSQFFDRGDGRIPAVEANPALAALLRNATGSSAVFQRPPVNNLTQGNTSLAVTAGDGGVTIRPPPNATQVGPLAAADRAAGFSGQGAAEPALPGAPRPGLRQQPTTRLQSFADALNSALKASPAAVQALFESGVGQRLLARVSDSVLAEAVDGTTQLIANQGSKVLSALAEPLARVNQAVGGLGQALATGASEVGVKAAVAAIEAAEPALAARAELGKAVAPAAKASKDAAARLAAESQAKAREAIAQLPAGADKEEVLAAFNKLDAPQGRDGGAAQMG